MTSHYQGDLTPRKTVILTLLFALVILSHYVTKPARDAFITLYWGSKAVPYIGLGVLGLSFVISRLSARAYSRSGPRLLLPYVASVTAAFYIVFPLLNRSSPAYATLGLAVVMTLFNLFGLAFTWGAIDSCYRSRESWPAFTVIGTGGPLGAVVGGLAATVIATRWGAYATLLAGACLVTATAFLYPFVVAWRVPDRLKKTEAAVDSPDRGFVLHDRYARGLLYFALFASCVSVVFKLSIFRLAELSGGNSVALTQYFAAIYTNIGVVSLVAQLVVTPLSFRFLGPRRSLLVVPILVVAAGVMGVILPDPRALSWIVIVYLGLDYTLNQCSKELAYVPTSEDLRFRGKPLIDSSGKQLGVVAGNFGLILLTGVVSGSTLAVAAVIVLLGVAWVLSTIPVWQRSAVTGC